MTTKSITSRQEKQIGRFAEVSAGNATLTALEQLGLDSDTAQTKVIMCGDQFQAMIQPGMTKLIAEALNRLSGRRHPAADDIEKYFLEVFGVKIDLTGVLFPEKKGFPAYMARPPGLDEDFVMTKLAAHFSVTPYIWQTPAVQNINRELEQDRPAGLYVFAHVGGGEPDTAHLGKSYDDAIAAKMLFLNPLEYLLATGFQMWKHRKWLDSKGWTRTSSLWSDGRLVRGCFSPGNRRLCLSRGIRDGRHADSGPRELFLG